MIFKPYQSSFVKTWNFFSLKQPSHICVDELWDNIKDEVDIDAKHLEHLKEPLKVLIKILNDSDNFHPFGHYYIKSLFTNLLKQRFLLAKYWQQNPQVLKQTIRKPLIITGLPRTGTSFLFNCLAQDPQHRYLTNWETTVSQIPPTKPSTPDKDPRRRVGKFLIKLQDYLAPQLKESHKFYLDGPEECTPLLMQSFCSSSLDMLFNDSSYTKWLTTAKHFDKYQHHKKILQTLENTYPGPRWLLKSPVHTEAICDLFKVYPDACVIQTHRAPKESIASCANLNLAFQGIYLKEIDLNHLGQETLNILARDMKSYLVDRKKCNPQQFIDINYIDLVQDPLSCIIKTYDHFSLPMTSELIQKFKSYIQSQNKPKKRHQYSLKKFSLNSVHIDQSFEEYIHSFDLQNTQTKPVEDFWKTTS